MQVVRTSCQSQLSQLLLHLKVFMLAFTYSQNFQHSNFLSIFLEHTHTTALYKDSNYQGPMIDGSNGNSSGNPYYTGLITSAHHNSPNYPISATTITSQSGNKRKRKFPIWQTFVKF